MAIDAQEPDDARADDLDTFEGRAFWESFFLDFEGDIFDPDDDEEDSECDCPHCTGPVAGGRLRGSREGRWEGNRDETIGDHIPVAAEGRAIWRLLHVDLPGLYARGVRAGATIRGSVRGHHGGWPMCPLPSRRLPGHAAGGGYREGYGGGFGGRRGRSGLRRARKR